MRLLLRLVENIINNAYLVLTTRSRQKRRFSWFWIWLPDWHGKLYDYVRHSMLLAQTWYFSFFAVRLLHTQKCLKFAPGIDPGIFSFSVQTSTWTRYISRKPIVTNQLLDCASYWMMIFFYHTSCVGTVTRLIRSYRKTILGKNSRRLSAPIFVNHERALRRVALIVLL